MNRYWDKIQNLGEHAELRKTPRLFVPLVPFDVEGYFPPEFQSDFHKIMGFAACIGCGIDLGQVMPTGGLCRECNAKKGKSCEKPRQDAPAASVPVARADTVTSRAVSTAGPALGVVSVASKSAPLESDSPESAGWVRSNDLQGWCPDLWTRGDYWIAKSERTWVCWRKTDCAGMKLDYTFVTGEGASADFRHWREIDAKLFPREFRIGDTVECLPDANWTLHLGLSEHSKIIGFERAMGIKTYDECANLDCGMPVRALKLVKGVDEE